MRAVTNRAALAHCLMLEDKRSRLIAMTSRTRLIESRQAKATSRFHDVSTMRIVALNTVHLAFNHRMMLRQRKLRVRLQVALKAGGRIITGIQNKLSLTAPHLDVFAPRTMTCFAPALSNLCVRNELHASVRTRWENLDVVGMTLEARLVTDVSGAGNGRADHDGPRGRGTGVCHAQN